MGGKRMRETKKEGRKNDKRKKEKENDNEVLPNI